MSRAVLSTAENLRERVPWAGNYNGPKFQTERTAATTGTVFDSTSRVVLAAVDAGNCPNHITLYCDSCAKT